MKELERNPLSVIRHPFQDHARGFADNRYVYAVVSRRSKGLSIGVNLNPDKVCNFDCIYCQVDRTTPGGEREVDVVRLAAELDAMLSLAKSGEIFQLPRFCTAPPHLRRLNDIAFSGDGEPTTCPQFLEAVRVAARLKAAHDLAAVKLILITNATQLHKPMVQEALDVMAANNGEVWAKLDAGTETYYHQIERTTVPFARVLANIAAAARRSPLVIQAMFLRLAGDGPSPAEREAFCERLNEIRRAGGRITLVQVYTVARAPAEATVTALPDAEVDAIAELVRRRTGLPAEGYFGK